MSEAHAKLMAQLSEDGLTERVVVVPTHEVVYVKSILEAYPGLASVHAQPGRETTGGARLVLASTRGLTAMLDAVIDELTEEVGLTRVTDTHASCSMGERP